MITGIVTCTNQKIENVRKVYKSRSGFTYDTNETEVRALLEILLFLGVKKSAKENATSIWAKDGTGMPICIAAMSKRGFLFFAYCLRFDDSTTRDQRRASDKLEPIRSIYEKFVAACAENCIPGVGCTVNESLFGFQGRCSFTQYIPNMQSKYGIKVYVLADSTSFYFVSSKKNAGAGTHIPGLPVPIQAVMDLIQPISGTNKNITTANYYTSISLAENLKASNLTLVGTMKNNKRCILPTFSTKADPGTVQYACDHANDFKLLSIAPKRNKRVGFLSKVHALPCHDEEAGKEEINVLYNHEKGGVDSHDQMHALYATARKTNRWLMRVFYGMIDSSALNAYLIFTHIVLAFGGNRPDKHSKFLKELAISLIVPHAKRRLVAPQTTNIVRQIIRSCGILPVQAQVVQSMNNPSASARKRCFLCPRSKAKKYRFTCDRCNKSICEEHSKMVCNLCEE